MKGYRHSYGYSARGPYADLNGGGFYGSYPGRLQPRELRYGLRELLKRLKQYDGLRLDMESRGGRLEQLASMSRLLQEPLCINLGGREREVSLVDQRGMRSALFSLDQDIHLQVRLKSTHMPVYYLCRTKTDYWNEYSLIVEDYYQSPGYPLADKRFARLMRMGHEQDFLRLSPFRREVRRLLIASHQAADDAEIDRQLHLLGRHVFQAAWHRDQQVGVAVAQHLEIPALAQAVELLYLCLSGELCEMRGAVSPILIRFFYEAYPQPAIEKLLNLLPGLAGEMLTNLPQSALAQYARLSRGFSRFLSQEIPKPKGGRPMPLWKLVYANLDRLEVVSRMLRSCPELPPLRKELDDTAQAVIASLLSQDA